MIANRYRFKTKVWLYPSETAAWHFVGVPKKESVVITKKFGAVRRGWRSLPVLVTIGKTSWETSIFYDKRSEEYLLPLKASVRKKEKILVGDIVVVAIAISV